MAKEISLLPKKILLPTNVGNETSEKMPEEEESGMKKELKVHQEKIKDIKMMISNIIERLEL